KTAFDASPSGSKSRQATALPKKSLREDTMQLAATANHRTEAGRTHVRLSLQELLRMSDLGLAQRDITEVNVACDEGLPGAELIDVDDCLGRLDAWARSVAQETECLLPQFHRKRSSYDNSEAYFRSLVMVTVLQRDLGVRYNREKIPEEVALDTEDTFIHGAIQGNGGTCASLPDVYGPVGRRLGCPLKLVQARTKKWSHLFLRWDDPRGERLNIEATSWGLNCEPDEYYRTGVYAITPEQEQKCCLLQSLTPRQELAWFF